MLLYISLKQALGIIEGSGLLLNETIVPRSCPCVDHSPYRPGYDWLFSWERKIVAVLGPCLNKFRYELIGHNGIISEALSNAFCHGNRKDSKLPVEIKIFQGRRGVIVSIQDTGNGFRVSKIHENFKKGKNYYNLAGNGFRLMMESRHFGVFFNNTGNIFQLIYLFDIDDIGSAIQCDIQCDVTKAEQPSKATSSLPIINISHDDDLWVRYAVLFNSAWLPLIAYGADPGQIDNLSQVCSVLLHGIDSVTDNLGIGESDYVSIITDTGTMALCKKQDDATILVIFTQENAGPAMAGALIPKILRYFREFMVS